MPQHKGSEVWKSIQNSQQHPVPPGHVLAKSLDST